jgi:thiamine pyrophosphate-dependent acetolactate synthase large subunit-like protein
VRRHDAVKAIVECFKDGYFVGCNGLISRELFDLNDGPRNFYVLGSMGLPTSIGLGLAMAKPEKRIVVVTGDGNQLMSLGTLATVGWVSPKNFVEVVLDNECYETTGGQETSSSTTRFSDLARVSGFKNAAFVESLDEFKAVLAKSKKTVGPILIHVKVETDKSSPSRSQINPCYVKERFMKALVEE